MRNPQLMHPTVNRLSCLLERARKEFQMVILAVVVRHGTGFMMACCLLDIGQPALNQGQHVVCCFWVKHPPLTTDRDVDRRGVSDDAASPAVVVWDSLRIIRSRRTVPQSKNVCLPLHWLSSVNVLYRLFPQWKR